MKLLSYMKAEWILLGLLSLMPIGGRALTLIDFDLNDLVRMSTAVVVFEVVGSESPENGYVEYIVDPVDKAFGGFPEENRLQVLDVPEAPNFDVGKTYLVFYSEKNTYEKVLGYRFATYVVDDEGGLWHLSGDPVQVIGRRVTKGRMTSGQERAMFAEVHGSDPSHSVQEFVHLVSSIRDDLK